jgi:hypothetical protein
MEQQEGKNSGPVTGRIPLSSLSLSSFAPVPSSFVTLVRVYLFLSRPNTAWHTHGLPSAKEISDYIGAGTCVKYFSCGGVGTVHRVKIG